MSEEAVDLDEVVAYLKLVEIVAGMAMTAWFVWAFIVPVAVKIDLKAWWATHMKPAERDKLTAQLRWNLIELESMDHAQLAREVERLPRVA